MDELVNPLISIPFGINLIFDPNRLNRLSPKKMIKYRDKALRKTINYAYKVPLYKMKYETEGIYKNDIKNIKDLTKLPFITKKDIVDNFPDGIVPNNYNKDKAQIISTSGSTGKPITFYTDFSTMSRTSGLYLRSLKMFNLNWRKVRVAHIGNFSQGKADSAFEKGFFSKLNFFYNTKNYLLLNNFDPVEDIIKKLDDFKPDMILSYPITFKNLAFFKNKGYGKHINPKVLNVGGYVLDEYTRKYVENAFACRMLNIYSSAESGADIAFECMEGTWHINHDFYHVESLDENLNVLSEGKLGHIVITRLFGRGTPIVRYIGMDDWVKLVESYSCNCGLNTPIIKDGVRGRVNTNVILPDGRVFPSASFAIISVILNDLKIKKVRQFQIVQKKIDQIDILIVIDEDLRDVGMSIDLIFKHIKEVYEKKVGSGVAINVKEVNEIKSIKGKPAPLLISHIKTDNFSDLVD
jgi:phenylacetate-CoA ligase